MKPIVLVNASAGTAAQFTGEDVASRVCQAFRSAGLEAENVPVAPGGPGQGPDEAARQLAGAQERAIDLGRVGRRRFHTLGGLGFFSRVARQRAEIRKTLPNRVIGAAVAAFRSLTTGGNLEIEIDDGSRRQSFRTPAVL